MFFLQKRLRYSLSPAYIVLAFVLTVVPDQEADNNDDNSPRNKPHQESGHINPARFVIFCGK